VLAQNGNLSLEIWSSDGCRLKNSSTIKAAFERIPTSKGETGESLRACASSRRPSLSTTLSPRPPPHRPGDSGVSRHRGDMIDLYATTSIAPHQRRASRLFHTPMIARRHWLCRPPLRLAEKLVFVFPHGGLTCRRPEGFFDRVLVPGVASTTLPAVAHFPRLTSTSTAFGGEFDRRTLVGHASVHGRPGPPPNCPRIKPLSATRQVPDADLNTTWTDDRAAR